MAAGCTYCSQTRQRGDDANNSHPPQAPPGPFIPPSWVRPPLLRPPPPPVINNPHMSTAAGQSSIRMPVDSGTITTGIPRHYPSIASHQVAVAAGQEPLSPRLQAGMDRSSAVQAQPTRYFDRSNALRPTSSPFVHRNRFEVLSTDDETGQPDSDDPFVVSESRRARRIRQREESSSQSAGRRGEQPRASARPGARLMTGSSVQASGQVTAARKWVKRQPSTVLYIDNLSKNCATYDLVSFVKNLSVQVLSCYRVTPRHRRGQAPDNNRSAFRLCIPLHCLDIVLDPTVWPDCVTISEWVYMDPSISRPDNKRGRFHSPPSPPAVNRRDDHHAASGGEDDMESTVVYSGTDSATEVKSPAETTAATGTDDRPQNGVAD